MFFGMRVWDVVLPLGVLLLGAVGLLALAHNPEEPQVTPLLMGAAATSTIGIFFGSLTLQQENLSTPRRALLIILMIFCLLASCGIGIVAIASTLLVA